MKKRVWQRVWLFTPLVLLLFITSCAYKPEAGETPLETEAAINLVKTGTQGVEINFLPDYPPPTLYDTTEFVAIAEVWNKGNYDLEPGTCFIHLTGYDPNIIKGLFPNYFQPCSLSSVFEGKKTYNLEGSFNQLEFRSSNVYLPPGIHDYNPTLNLVACYQYQTIASPLVCIENTLFQVASEQKACDSRNPIIVGGGQGAPVGLSYVDADMAGDKAIFTINVRNYGSGRVLSPDSSLANCPSTLDYSDFDKVGYSVELSGASLIDCKPIDGLVRLSKEQGKIFCTFNIGNVAAYETPLIITLSYNYMQSLKKPVKIIKTPGYD